MGIISLSGIIIVGILFSLLIKKDNPTLALIISISLFIIICFIVANRLIDIVLQLKSMFGLLSVKGEYIQVLLKIIGITFVSGFTTDICKDCGFNALASGMDMFCRVTIAGLSVPIIIALFETVNQCITF